MDETVSRVAVVITDVTAETAHRAAGPGARTSVRGRAIRAVVNATATVATVTEIAASAMAIVTVTETAIATEIVIATATTATAITADVSTRAMTKATPRNAGSQTGDSLTADRQIGVPLSAAPARQVKASGPRAAPIADLSEARSAASVTVARQRAAAQRIVALSAAPNALSGARNAVSEAGRAVRGSVEVDAHRANAERPPVMRAQPMGRQPETTVAGRALTTSATSKPPPDVFKKAPSSWAALFFCEGPSARLLCVVAADGCLAASVQHRSAARRRRLPRR